MRDHLSELEPTIVKNKHYEDDLRYTIQFCQWFLKSIGIWPMIKEHASRLEVAISVLWRIVYYIVLVTILVPTSLFIYRDQSTIFAKVKLFGPIIFCVTSSIKYSYLGSRGHAFGKCIRHVRTDWRLVENDAFRQIMMRNATLGRSLTLLCTAFLYTGGFSYLTILPIFSKKVINENFTFRPLAFPGYDFFMDAQSSPNYEILLWYHCIFGMAMFNATIAACSLSLTFVTHACGQIQIIMVKLQDLVEGSQAKETSVEDRLGDIVRHHVQVLRFAANIDEVLREICLMELVASSLSICMVQYYCMKEWENGDPIAIMTNFIILIAFTFDCFIFCYIGELLVNQCTELGSACYTINWYNFIGNKGRNLILLIAMSSYPPKLTAGKIVELSFSTFSNVLKSAIAYLNLLRIVAE